MRYSWRWFGPNDPVPIQDVMQVGATDVVSALHHIPNGQVWTIEEIKKRQHEVEWDAINKRTTGLKWNIVESVPVHEDIKRRTGNYLKYIENYKQSLANLAQCGIKIVIYNFMPILDWTRTNLYFELPNGTKALKYDHLAFVAFDVFLLQRENARIDYTEQEIADAKVYLDNMSVEAKDNLVKTLIAGLPGAEESFTLENFRDALAKYNHIDKTVLRSNLVAFLKEVIPVAEAGGIRMAIHPDDPPRNILGLPRILSNIEDITYLMNAIPSANNGLNLCAGSLGVNPDNDLVAIFNQYGSRIPFVHLRAVKRDGKSFYEDEHLAGSTSLFGLVKAIVSFEKSQGREVFMRPDHGHQMLDDLHKTTNPGYSCIGRMKGLAEIKGMALGIENML